MSNFDPDFENPYRTPTTVDAPPPQEVDGEAVAIRRQHLNHEASIQGVGSLYVLGGILSVLGALIFVGGVAIGPLAGGLGGAEIGFGAVMMLFILCVGGFQLMVGLGMRKVKPWVKIPASILAVLGLLSFPIGTMLSLYILYLLHSSKGQVVLAGSYQHVIADTPEIKYKTSIIVKVLAFILLALIVIGIGAALFSA